MGFTANKFFIFVLIYSVLVGASFGEIYFSDVPENHWATEAVYELVKMGITTGYPDGTFRGKENISRYEVASFLSRLIKSFKLRQGADEKLIEELKSELALIRYKRKRAEEAIRFSGAIESHYRLSTTAPRGGKRDYRLKLNLVKEFYSESSLKIGLDTVDAGFDSDVSRNLATKLVDFEGRFRFAGLNFKVNFGPGTIPHTEDFFPSERNVIYLRPKTAIKASTKIKKLNLSGSYVTRQVETSGKIGVHELTGKIGYNFGKVALSFRPRYLFIQDGPHDFLAEVGLDYRPSKNWETNLLLCAGAFKEGRSGMYVKVIERIKDPWKTRTNITLRFDKVGSKYRQDDLDEYEFIYLNNFERLILDGTVDIGLKVNQGLTDKLSLEWKGDYVTTGDYKYGEAYPETYFLWQLGLSYDFSSTVNFNAFYRSYSVPSEVAQFSDPVPKVSEIIGIGAKCSF